LLFDRYFGNLSFLALILNQVYLGELERQKATSLWVKLRTGNC